MARKRHENAIFRQDGYCFLPIDDKLDNSIKSKTDPKQGRFFIL